MTKSEKTEDGNEIHHPIEQEQVVEEKPVIHQPTVVGVSAAATIPTEPYANVKVGVYLSVTVEPSEIEDTFEFISTWVGDKLSGMIAEVEGGK